MWFTVNLPLGSSCDESCHRQEIKNVLCSDFCKNLVDCDGVTKISNLEPNKTTYRQNDTGMPQNISVEWLSECGETPRPTGPIVWHCRGVIFVCRSPQITWSGNWKFLNLGVDICNSKMRHKLGQFFSLLIFAFLFVVLGYGAAAFKLPEKIMNKLVFYFDSVLIARSIFCIVLRLFHCVNHT